MKLLSKLESSQSCDSPTTCSPESFLPATAAFHRSQHLLDFTIKALLSHLGDARVLFVTLTFEEHVRSTKAAQKQLNCLLNAVRERYGGYGHPREQFRHSWLHVAGCRIDAAMKELDLPVGEPFAAPDVALLLQCLSTLHHELACQLRPDFRIAGNLLEDGLRETARLRRGELGIELFVLDDGWFGQRNDDRSSLGDWTVDQRKLPGGLGDLAKRITRSGMAFGLWFEPEMVSPDSDLYRAHPDWCLHVPCRVRTLGRNQLVLDLSRADVCDHLIEAVSSVLASAPISYVKWDMNRHLTEIGSALLPPERQRETAHRHILGLYRVLEEITGRFPQVLFESCSGGGGRFDPGMLFYMPQTWTSDNSDAVSRLKIQYGTSLVYPLSAMGAHVSAVPNHQVHRTTTLETRGLVAMSGNFGYELDLCKFTVVEQVEVRAQVVLYKEIRELVQTGDLYRLRDPFEDHSEAAWIVVDASKSEAVCFYFHVLAEANAPLRRLRLRGLDPQRDYKRTDTGEHWGGDTLMHAGLAVPELAGDFRGVMWRFRAV